MSALLPALAAGGVIGAADQYLCLLLLGVASRMGWIELAPEMMFVESWWFMGIVGLLWVLTVTPAYASFLAPGVANFIYNSINMVSGFVVPASSAIAALASLGIIRNLHPDLETSLMAVRLFDPAAGLGVAETVVAGGGALTATALMILKALSKPAFSAGSGTMGTVDAPIYATIENLSAVVLMGLIILLVNTDPRWLVVLLITVVVIMLGLFFYALYLLWKLKRGLGLLLVLLQQHPRHGWSIVAESLVWGSGWMLWGYWRRGGIMLLIWFAGASVFTTLLPVAGAMLLFFVPFVALSLMVFGMVAGKTARDLMKTIAPTFTEPSFSGQVTPHPSR